MAKKKTKRERVLSEGDGETLTVHRFMGGVSVSLPRKALRYLNVKTGDRLTVVARNGVLEISPVLTVEQEIEKYLSQ